MFDIDGSGEISLNELAAFVDRESGSLLQDIDFTSQVIDILDIDKDGTLSLPEVQYTPHTQQQQQAC